MLTYQLGPFRFHGEWGAPQFTQAAIAGETRPGVNGVSTYNLGTWGRPFEIETVIFCINWPQAIAICKAYQAASSLTPLGLVIGGVAMTGGAYKVLMVDAKPKAILRVKIAGDPTVYQAEVRAKWSLLPIATPIS